MPDPVDLESLYDAMISAKSCLDYGLISKSEFQEDLMGLKQIKRRVMRQLAGQKRDVEDAFDPKDYKR